MSTVTPEASSTTDRRFVTSLFDHPGADIVLRSQDSHHIQVPKNYIVNSSPVLGELIRKASDSPSNANAGVSLPVVQLPESGEILHCLLTFIFPVTPRIPSTLEGIMELLSVAQKYQMGTALAHIRAIVAQQNLLPTRLDPALRIYALAQKYGLREEALQTARTISKYPMTIEDFDNKLDIMPGASLYELWEYHEWVWAILASDLTEFRESGARGTMTGLRCTNLSSSQIPSWVDQYIVSIGNAPNLFDPLELNIAMTRHVKNWLDGGCECGSISSQTIHEFWESLVSVVHDCFKKAESALSLVQEREDPQSRINPTTSPLNPSDASDANLVIRSSDFVNFKVHKLVLAVASPFFKDLLSLPQPPDSESADGLPVVQLSEDSELLSTLVSMLYPLRPVIPNSYDKVLYLLAACQKYEMASVQLTIRGKVNCGEFPGPKGTDAFAAYAIASSKELIPEMEKAARQTLDHSMTFEALGKGLRLFEGWALRDLANFRRRCSDNLSVCFDSYPRASSSCHRGWLGPGVPVLPMWLYQFLSQISNDLELQVFTHPLDIHSRIREEYFKALHAHLDCKTCLVMHATQGSAFCAELEKKLVQARDKVSVRSLNDASV